MGSIRIVWGIYAQAYETMSSVGPVFGEGSVDTLDTKIATGNVRIFNDRDDKLSLCVVYRSGTNSGVYVIDYLNYIDFFPSNIYCVSLDSGSAIGNGFSFYGTRHSGKLVRVYNTYVTSDDERLDLARCLEDPPAY